MKNIWKIDLVLISFTLIALLILVGYAQPLVIAPLDEYESSDGGVLFLVEKANVVLIDDNFDFTSPDKYFVKEGLEINLEPGKYYWKAVGVLDGEIRTLTIKSKVSLEFVKIGEDFGVVNSGNVGLNVDVYNGTELIDKIKLGVGENSVANGTKLIGGMT